MNDPILVARAMADETRWRILCLVYEDALCVCELADVLGMPQSTLSSHLQILRRAGLLDHERCEKWIYYKVAGAARPLLSGIFRQFASSHARVMTESTLDMPRKAARLARRCETLCRGPKRLPQIAKRRNFQTQ